MTMTIPRLELGLDLAAVNPGGITGLPLSTTAVVDAGRVARWIEVHPDRTTGSDPSDTPATSTAAPR
jgi:hypothetical protein